MKHTFAFALALSIGCAHGSTAARDVSWMREATVTVMRLSGYNNPDPRGLGAFHGLDIREVHTLDASSRGELVEFLTSVAAREDREEMDAKRKGEVTGGVWGCVSGTRGIRFETTAGTYDFVVECNMWIQAAPGTERVGPQQTFLVFTQSEGKEWLRVFERHFAKGP